MNRPRILDPHRVPVAGHDGHLPAVDAPGLAAPALRRRFALGRMGTWEPELRGDGRVAPGDRAPTEAAVLVPLVQRPDGLHVLLTRRTDHLHDHAGQISFPGGRRDEGDADAVATALRETQEEIGLEQRHIEIIGQLPAYTTITRYVVTPVVALVQPPFELQLDSFEVAEAFEVPLPYLMNPGHHQRHVFEWAGEHRQFLSMPWHDGQREYFIWGATAAMLRNFYRFLCA